MAIYFEELDSCVALSHDRNRAEKRWQIQQEHLQHGRWKGEIAAVVQWLQAGRQRSQPARVNRTGTDGNLSGETPSTTAVVTVAHVREGSGPSQQGLTAPGQMEFCPGKYLQQRRWLQWLRTGRQWSQPAGANCTGTGGILSVGKPSTAAVITVAHYGKAEVPASKG